jgi:cardiolipin synthase
VEARLMLTIGACLLALALLMAFFPRLLSYPLAALLTWLAITLIFRGWKLGRQRKRDAETLPAKDHEGVPDDLRSFES